MVASLIELSADPNRTTRVTFEEAKNAWMLRLKQRRFPDRQSPAVKATRGTHQLAASTSLPQLSRFGLPRDDPVDSQLASSEDLVGKAAHKTASELDDLEPEDGQKASVDYYAQRAKNPNSLSDQIAAANQLNGTSSRTLALSRDLEANLEKLGLNTSLSEPSLSATFDKKKGAFVCSPRTQVVCLPPLTLSLEEVIARDARAHQNHPTSTQGQRGATDNPSGSREDELVLSESDARLVALKRFNSTHSSCSTKARDLLADLEDQHSEDLHMRRMYKVAIGEVFRNRLWLNESLTFDPPILPKPAKRPRRRPWKLDDSTIWAPRKLRGNSKDYYETDASMRSVFDADWQLARLSLNSTMKDTSSEIVGEMLWRHHKTLYGCIDYYSTLFDNGKDSSGEVDIFALSFNAYTEFARDCGLISRSLPLKELDIIWTAVNALPRDSIASQIDRFNHLRTMSRHEFLRAMVQFASKMYLTGRDQQVDDLPAAVEKLCTRIARALPPEAMMDSNAFRKSRCYKELTDRELCSQRASLKAIFDVYARSNQNVNDELQHVETMSIGEWLSFLEHFGLYDHGQITLFGSKLIFKWSIIRAYEDFSAESERKMRQMSFCDFCEALVRVACRMALPTDAELEASTATNAFEYLNALSDAGEDEITGFVAERKVAWHAQPRQHVSRCVFHLLQMLVCTVRQTLSRSKSEAALQRDEVRSFKDKRREGRPLYHVQSKAGLLDGVRASASIVRNRMLEALCKVKIFSELNAEQMMSLQDAMSYAPFKRGEYVFDQGAEGDSFYIVTEGQAAVMRSEPGSKEDVELAVVGESSYFGERALIKNEVRYAGVRADSLHLHTVFITRKAFETALGVPLEHLVPDHYLGRVKAALQLEENAYEMDDLVETGEH